MLAAQAWLALLRVVVGAWFLKAVWTKLAMGLAWDVLPYPTVSPRFVAFHPKRVAEFAAGNPIGWYKDFLEHVVLPHAALFATLLLLMVVCAVVLALVVLVTVAAVLVAAPMGFHEEPFYQDDDPAIQSAPKVSFGQPAA